MLAQRIMIPSEVRKVLLQLNRAGFAAYAVGGCVRDSLLGRMPQDWDICTSALPEQTQACFADDRVLLTGIRYGTVTVLRGAEAYEITTFRAEAGYQDARHPEEVRFLPSLHGDLMRRDFTVNAMAADAEGEITDLFGGREDLQSGVIRCVGVPEERFEEDALRILRGLRFAARLGFAVAPETAAAIHCLRQRLCAVAPERLRKELSGLLTGCGASAVLREFSDVICVLIPELAPCVGFRQYNPRHALDVWEHTLAALEASEAKEPLRLAVLLHDIGKPPAFSMDKQLVGHFYGHAVIGGAMTERILRRLRYDHETVQTVSELVRLHDRIHEPVQERQMKRLLSKHGEHMLRQLLRLRRADLLGKKTQDPEEIERLTEEAETLLERVSQQCVTLRQLSVTGRDLLALGVPEGPQIGSLLQRLLDAVLSGTLPNARDALLDAARQWAKCTN